MSLRAGARLGPHEILGPIGAGGMGEVYRARDSRLGREVAIKVLPASAIDPSGFRRLEQEARAAGVLNHPNVLAIFDVGVHEGAPYLVSELLEGETLRDRLSEGPLPLRKALDYATQTAHGLAAAHEKGIVHRDLKPENLFVTREGRIKILDFGLAKVASPPARVGTTVAGEKDTLSMNTPGTAPGTILGTAGYMSPEQVRGGVADHRSDIFSLGAIIYEMLSGQRAFRGDSAVETMNAILKEDPPEIAELQGGFPPALDRIVRRCLEKKASERFQSVRDVAFALEALSGISGTPTSPALAPLPRRRRIGLAIGALAAVALLAVFLQTHRLGRQAPPTFTQVTFRRGLLATARFAPDGATIVYSARWNGKGFEILSARPGNPESRALGLPEGFVASISSSGEMALVLRRGPGLVLAQAPLAGGEPRDLLEGADEADWAPDGATLAVTRSEAGLQRLEYPLGKVLYQTPNGLWSPSVSPGGDRVALLETQEALGAQSVVIVDRAGKKVVLSGDWRSVRDAYTSARFQGLRWSAKGDEVWFTAKDASGATALHAVTLSGRRRLVARLPGAMILRDIARDGRVLLSRENVRSETRGRAPGEAEERDLSWLDGSWVLDLSSDGRTLLFSEQGEGGGARRAIYLRQTDGSPAVRLGEGTGSALSADGKWAVSLNPADSTELVLLPTGPGQPRSLKVQEVTACAAATWFPDGKRILLVATEPGRRWRVYVQSLTGGPPRAIAPEGTRFIWGSSPVSPDGSVVFAESPEGSFWLYPVERGEARPLPGLDATAREIPVRWSSNGRSIYVWRAASPPRVYRVDMATHRRELWREIRPPDMAGVSWLPWVLPTPDGTGYVYSYRRTLSDLYLVEGLR